MATGEERAESGEAGSGRSTSERVETLPRHPIGVVSERTGLSHEVLRAWERRYSVVEPSRDDAGHRLYSDEDIERLRLIRLATDGGRRVGQAVELSIPELKELVREDHAARLQVPGRGGREDGPSVDPKSRSEAEFSTGGVVTADVLAACLRRIRAMDAEGLEGQLRSALLRMGGFAFLEDVVAPLFRAVGDRWHRGELGIHHEHLATAVALPLLSSLRSSTSPVAGAPVMVVGTLAGERHELGGLLVAVAGALVGWRVIYLGADLPLQALSDAAREKGADVVAVSVVGEGEAGQIERELRGLLDRLPVGTEILVGGGGAGRYLEASGPGALAGVTVLTDLNALRDHLRARKEDKTPAPDGNEGGG
jgi:MerR family transcriptional regulator, light-induced transcriptional regulator